MKGAFLSLRRVLFRLHLSLKNAPQSSEPFFFSFLLMNILNDRFCIFPPLSLVFSFSLLIVDAKCSFSPLSGAE